MPAPREILTVAQTMGDEFVVLREKAFILFTDLPATATARIEMQDPAGDWVDISSGSGVRFEDTDFNAGATKPGALKFFYVAQGQKYRILASVVGGRAWLLYNDRVVGS